MEPRKPTHDHLEFDALCADVEDFERLPEMKDPPVRVEDGEDDDAPFDRQIMAGLISPA